MDDPEFSFSQPRQIWNLGYKDEDVKECHPHKQNLEMAGLSRVPSALSLSRDSVIQLGSKTYGLFYLGKLVPVKATDLKKK